jgi:hemerythrin
MATIGLEGGIVNSRITTVSLAWSDELSTGVESLDAQHKALFDCLIMLEDAAEQRSMIKTFTVMERLSNYVYKHFAEEESLMRFHNYPRLSEHIREHRDFTNRLFGLRRTYLDRDINGDLLLVLREWLMLHLSKSDMEYVPYLTANRLNSSVGSSHHAMATLATM